MSGHSISRRRFDAVLFDLDGVVTQTAKVHARAWKAMFDAYLRTRSEVSGETFEPFDITTDYRRHVDGKPRYEGVASFLSSRGIQLPHGSPEDPPDAESICGLGNRKNRIFRQKIRETGVEIYATSVDLIRELRSLGFRTAVVSSSRNTQLILESAGITDLFDARVDGLDADNLGLAGKPAPGVFLEAARRLGVEPGRTIVVEDAIAGVEAGQRGDFGYVVGVDRVGQAEPLSRAGADLVVEDLGEVRVGNGAAGGTSHKGEPPSALDRLDTILPPPGGRLAVFLDYDGTLTPIVAHPDLAVLPDRMRTTVERLADRCPVAILSGRDLADVRDKVGIDGIYYAGSHGFDIAGPDRRRLTHQQGNDYLPDLDQAEAELRQRLDDVAGCLVERKRFAIAVHFRQVAERNREAVRQSVETVQQAHPGLRLTGGKKIHELRPDIEWDKGKALRWLLQAMGLDAFGVTPLYIGDDLTDEDAFLAVRERGVGILVADRPQPSHAAYRLKDPREVQRFLDALVDALEATRA